MPWDTCRRTPCWLSELSALRSPNVWLHYTPECNLLDYYVCFVGKQETKDELKARLIAVFINLNKKAIRKACSKFPSYQDASSEVHGEFVENILYSLSSYVPVILINISDKMSAILSSLCNLDGNLRIAPFAYRDNWEVSVQLWKVQEFKILLCWRLFIPTPKIEMH